MGNAFNRAGERQRSIRQLREGIAKHPFLSVCFGLYWMQTVLLFQSPYLFLEASPLVGGAPGATLPKGTLLLMASVITYVAWSLNYRRVNAISEARWYPIALTTTLVAGAVLYIAYPSLAASHPDLSLVLYLAGSVLIGCGTANICLELGRIFGYLGPQQVLFHGIFAIALGTLGALLLSLFPTAVGKAVLVAMPIPMVACLWKSFSDVPRATLYGQGMKTKIHVPTKFLLTSLFQGLALGVMHSLLINNFGSSSFVVSAGYFAAVALLFFCSIAVKNNFDVLLYRIGFPLMAGGFFVVGMADTLFLAGALCLDTGYCFQYLMTCSLCAYLAKGLGQPPVWIVGTGTACLLAGQFIGSLLDLAVPDVRTLTVCVAFFLVLAALFMTSSKNLERGWGAVSPGSSAEPTDSTGMACQLLASEHGLSKREIEVFDLIVKGYSRKAIGRELSLSEETVKTHATKIYQKFLVHSKQELIELAAARASALER